MTLSLTENEFVCACVSVCSQTWARNRCMFIYIVSVLWLMGTDVFSEHFQEDDLDKSVRKLILCSKLCES